MKRTCLLLAIVLLAPVAHANPVGPTVVSGNVQVQQNGNTLTIQNSGNAIINWQSFSIGSGEVTNFVQPSAGSVVLNRVTGGTPSQLSGTLQSNGGVYLVNSSGVLFGAGAQVNVVSFVATTGEISDAAFLAGNPFSGVGNVSILSGVTLVTTGGGSISSAGGISVTNSGSTSSTGGSVSLGGSVTSGGSVAIGSTSSSGGVVVSTPGKAVILPPAPGAAPTLAAGTARQPVAAIPQVSISLQKREPLY